MPPNGLTGTFGDEKMEKKVELLAPAGNKEQFIAAVENGADAVYTSGRFLNARQAAEGLTDDELVRAVGYAHLRGVKVYVTMNTLVTDDELDDGVRYAEFLYESGVDAVLIQDLGLGKLIRDRVPGLGLHLSTQASAVGPVAISAAASLGYSRVVTARELSLSEIRAACANAAGAEVEVFCHGALCVCYSGQCQLSRYNGGRSGNRGTCAQPCRLRYRTVTEGGAALTDGIPNYPLSPKDLCLIDDLGDLIKAGVASLKIEGRLKTPEYVAVVTGIYRKYIDKYYQTGYYTVSKEDREALTQIFSRGGSSKGYFDGRSGRELICGDIPKNSGIKVGTVVGTRKNGQLIDVKLDHDIETGDGIEIHGAELISNIVTYIKDRGNGVVTIGDFKGTPKEGDAVYRTSSKSQLKEARRSFKNMDFESTGRRKLPIDITLRIAGDELVLHAETKEGEAAECVRDIPDSLAKGEGTQDRFIKALSKTGGTPFAADQINIPDEVKDLSMKVSEINEMRRSALEDLKERILSECRREPSPYFTAEKAMKESGMISVPEDENEPAPGNDAPRNEDADGDRTGTRVEMYADNTITFSPSDEDEIKDKDGNVEREETEEASSDSDDEFWENKIVNVQNEKPGTIELYFLDWNDFVGFRAGPEVGKLLAEHNVTITALIPLIDVIRNAAKLTRVKFKPYISAITKGKEDSFLNNHFDAVQAVVKQTGAYVGNLDWVTPLVKRGMTVWADYGLNVFNSETPKALAELGVSGYQYSLEKAARDMGMYPLMTLEHAPEGGALIDPSGTRYIIKRRDFSSQVIIRPDYADEKELEREFRAAVRRLADTGASSVRIYI